MRFNLISNLTNGVGLQQDFQLLKQELENRGHQVYGVQFNGSEAGVTRADINIFLEVVNPTFFKYAKYQWAVPNPEWWFKDWDQYRWDKILAKTRDCQRIFGEKFGAKCTYLGWTARDLYDPSVIRQDTFLHVAGKSLFKNTRAVIDACKMAGIQLTLVSQHYGNRNRLSEDHLKDLMNTHRFHLMPSAYEGFGQVLHEAMSCGQVIITTDAPPMNEIDPAFYVPSRGSRPHHYGSLHTVLAKDILETIFKVLQLNATQLETWQHSIRDCYLNDEKRFRRNLTDLLEGL